MNFKIMRKLFSALLILVFFSCDDTLTDLQVNQAAPRLVIEAILTNETKAIDGAPVLPSDQNNYEPKDNAVQTITLSFTSPYGDLEKQYATGATVKVRNLSQNKVFEFNEIFPGMYQSTDFTFSDAAQYQLEILYGGMNYIATSKYIRTPNINFISQGQDQGVTKEWKEINVNFDDPSGEDFYHFKMSVPGKKEVNYIFRYGLDGVPFNFAFEMEGRLETGNFVTYTLRRYNQSTYNFFRKLVDQADSQGPYTVPSTELKGNIVNQTNPELYPYGFFLVTEESKGTVVVQ
ncbi:MAG: hypothetical protein C4K58_00230 [Flavobacteriaceae bacterium]|nr:MAG: hypothetical protein C4K58_00230 [Flavobacteriaceae bacterium]